MNGQKDPLVKELIKRSGAGGKLLTDDKRPLKELQKNTDIFASLASFHEVLYNLEFVCTYIVRRYSMQEQQESQLCRKTFLQLPFTSALVCSLIIQGHCETEIEGSAIRHEGNVLKKVANVFWKGILNYTNTPI